MNQAWFTVKQARIYLGGMSREKLRLLEKSGELVPDRVGRRVYYREDALRLFMAKQHEACQA